MGDRSVKDGILRIAGHCIRNAPAAWLTRSFFRRYSNVVFLHGVWERGTARKDIFGGLYVDEFAELIDSLSTFFEFVEIEKILNPDANEKWGLRPRMHLTFDDGLDLVNSGAMDVLNERGISATVFVNTACVTNTHLMWQHLISAVRRLKGGAVFLKELNDLQERIGQELRVIDDNLQIEATRRWPMARKDEYATVLWAACEMPPMTEFLAQHLPYLNWGDLRSLKASGHTIGFHTHTHPFSSSLTEDQIETEIVTPVSQLHAQLGVGAIPFAYPFGDSLAPERAARLAESGIFSCLMGTGRFSRIGDGSNEIGRVEVESDVETEVFSRPIVQAIRSIVR